MTARQYHLPGGFYADEEGRRTYFVPGFGYQTENNVNVFNETLHEDLTTNFFFGLTFNETLHEDLTADFSYAATVRYFDQHVAPGSYIQEGGPPSFLVPGLGYFNSTAGRSSPVPGAFNFINQPLAENLTADYSLANSQGFGEQFRSVMHGPDLVTTTRSQSPGPYGMMAFGVTYFGGPAIAAGHRRDQMAFGAEFKTAMLAPGLPEATAKSGIGCFGGMTFGTTPYGGNPPPTTSPGIIVRIFRVLRDGFRRVVKVYKNTRTVTPQ